MDEFLWSEKYRPTTVRECILPVDLKKAFQAYVDQKNIPTLILSGTSGLGKTTVAHAMLTELGFDYILINASLHGNIDTLRNEITAFATTVSLSGSRKYIILDEADYLNPQSTQPALRQFMDEYSPNCGFIFTCNHKNRLIPALHSRNAVIEFIIPKDEAQVLAAQFHARVMSILEKENVKAEALVVAKLIMKFFPDLRRVLNELQRHSIKGEINSKILTTIEIPLAAVMKMLKEKKFTDMRKWVAENVDVDTANFYARLYSEAADYIKLESIPQLVITIADYQYKEAFVANREINLVACLTEIMVNCAFKD